MLYIFPACRKMTPYYKYFGGPTASEMLTQILEVITFDLQVETSSFENLGRRQKDMLMFEERIRIEGLIKLPDEEMLPEPDQHEEL